MTSLTNDLAASDINSVLAQHSKGFSAIFVVSFVVLLSIAVVASLLTLRWRTWWPGAEGESSLIGSVKASVYTFMSYLS